MQHTGREMERAHSFPSDPPSKTSRDKIFRKCSEFLRVRGRNKAILSQRVNIRRSERAACFTDSALLSQTRDGTDTLSINTAIGSQKTGDEQFVVF